MQVLRAMEEGSPERVEFELWIVAQAKTRVLGFTISRVMGKFHRWFLFNHNVRIQEGARVVIRVHITFQ